MGEQMKVRFLVNKATSKILYMEAGKDFVDVLLGFLQLPVATILSVFAEAGGGAPMQIGSLSNVYESLRKLSDSSFVVSKERLLHPLCPLELSRDNPKLLLPASASGDEQPNVIYTCSHDRNHKYLSWICGTSCPSCYSGNGHLSRAMAVLSNTSPSDEGARPDVIYSCKTADRNCNFVSWVSGQVCPSCRNGNAGFLKRTMHIVLNSAPDQVSDIPAPSTFSAASSSSMHSQGYVKEYLSFIVTDDLSILPASTIESIVLLNKLHVEKMSDLDSQEACVTAPEALELLKVSFTSQSALNLAFGTRVKNLSDKRRSYDV